MAVGDTHAFPGFLTPVLTQLSFQSHRLQCTFLTCYRSGRRKYAGERVCLNRVSNSQPPAHASDTLTTERSGRASVKKPSESIVRKGENAGSKQILIFSQCFFTYQGQFSSFRSPLNSRLQMLSIRIHLELCNRRVGLVVRASAS